MAIWSRFEQAGPQIFIKVPDAGQVAVVNR
jgi:hypothetical protein